MYLRILKKDLKRKKTMNIILLVFIILASMFVSSSVNNMVTVVNGLDYYFEKAGMSDYFVATLNQGQEVDVSETLDEISEIDNYGIENIIYMNPENLIYKGENLEKLKNTSILLSFEDAEITFFSEDNQPIEEVEPGTIWISQKCFGQCDMQPGDLVEVKIDNVSETFQIAGSFKDAVFGSDMMGMTRFIVQESDFLKFKEDKSISDTYGGSLCYINTSDTKAVEQILNEKDMGILFLGNIDTVKFSYIMDMVIAGVLLVISIGLILIAFLVLKFTIEFTITEEYREIGVMKAIGIENTKIRALYIIKYFALAIIGSAAGFVAGIPFGKLLLKNVSQSIVIGNDSMVLINLCCSLAVIVVIILFCFGCTRKVKTFTPVDAIRRGVTGERFKKKGLLQIKNTPGKPSFFLAVNDVLSHPRRFTSIILTFTLSLSLIMILVNTVNTLKSGSLATSFGMTESDAYYANDGLQMSFIQENGRKLLEDEIDRIEKTLAENDMPAECINEVMLKLTLVHGDNICKSQVLQGIRTTADIYEYFEGTPPQNAKEVAITPLISEKLDADIGDVITICDSSGEREYMVTALFQSMNNMGEGVRLHEDAKIDFLQVAGFFPFQINFTDNPDEEMIEQRIEQIKELYDTDNVYTSGEYVDRMIGVADMLDGVRQMVLLVVIIIVALITVLMERSFVTKERCEIALLKAVGFKTASIVKWHTIRFALVGVISAILSIVISTPITKLVITPVFKMMGASFGVEYKIVPFEVFVLCPCLIIVITIAVAFFTSLCTKTITASDTSGTE